MKVFIIDDEPIAQDVLKNFSGRLPFLKLTGVYDNAIEGMEGILSHQPDLIFLDIQMPEMTGVEMLRAVGNHSAQIVLTTAYPDYALDGFDLDAVDYLLKPIPFERFAKAVNKAHEIYNLRKKIGDEENIRFVDNSCTYVWVKEGRKLMQISLHDILLVEAMGDYVNLLFSDKKVIVHAKMSTMEKLLPPPNYLRVNRSTIIRRSAICSIEDLQIEAIIPGHGRISIGPTYWDHVKTQINTWLK